jgi:uncharacterized membrane protein
LPTLGGDRSGGAAVNDAGVIVGTASLGNGTVVPTRWVNGLPTALSTNAGSASDINAAGVITGTLSSAASAFRWTNGQMVEMGAYFEHATRGVAINASGQVAVAYAGATVSGGGCLRWSGAAKRHIGFIEPADPDRFTTCSGINDVGQIVGWSGHTAPGTSFARAFLWTSDGFDGVPEAPMMRDLGDFGVPTGNGAIDVNSYGQVVSYMRRDFATTHATLWTPDAVPALRDIHSLGHSSFPSSMNNTLVVGDVSSPGSRRAFVYSVCGGMVDLNTLIPAGSGWTLEFVRDVNNAGVIVGAAKRNGQDRGYVLRPPP